MKINFEIDDNDLIYQLMDGMFVVMLKNALREDKAYLEEGQFVHDDDQAQYEKNIAAYEHLIKYYSAPSEMNDGD
jgi:hypothetical protein